MATPKAPQDHKKKTAAKKPNAKFSFEHDGKKYTLKPTLPVLTASFYRKIRKGNALDQLCDFVEELAPDQATLDAFDALIDDDDKLKKFEADFDAHCRDVQGVTPGESEAS